MNFAKRIAALKAKLQPKTEIRVIKHESEADLSLKNVIWVIFDI